ncbi:hypothetical protein F0U60_04075 [Archangium minus]|uniref:Isopropylmalate dehydrogenase-like domain-containing protein n=1 Tax=Archangium minus TaxID=83450 RepID=A0ABY9WJC7_9BACT|nr:hypothetical protein F0U60_04075 [Archangium minus]
MKAQIVVVHGRHTESFTEQACTLFDWVSEQFGHELQLDRRPMGSSEAEWSGLVSACNRANAVLSGVPATSPVGADEETLALKRLGRELSLFASVRSFRLFPHAMTAMPLRPEQFGGSDALIVSAGAPTAEHAEVRATCQLAFRLARHRWAHVTAVDTFPALASEWNALITETATEFPGILLERKPTRDVLLQLMSAPAHWDVIVAPPRIADTLLDQGALLAGSMGLLPHALLGEGRQGLYQPLHGHVPEARWEEHANPTGGILAAAMLLRHSLGLEREATVIEAAAARGLAEWVRRRGVRGSLPVGTPRLFETIQAQLTTDPFHSLAV